MLIDKHLFELIITIVVYVNRKLHFFCKTIFFTNLWLMVWSSPNSQIIPCRCLNCCAWSVSDGCEEVFEMQADTKCLLLIWLLCTCSHYLQMSKLFPIISKTSMPSVTTLNLLFGNAFMNFQFLSLRYGSFSGTQHTPKPVQQLYVHWTCHTRDDYEGRLYSHHNLRLLLWKIV